MGKYAIKPFEDFPPTAKNQISIALIERLGESFAGEADTLHRPGSMIPRDF
jgi:hypothetical protein